MKSIYIKFIFCSVLLSALSLHSCTLDEYNPGAFTKEALATSIDGYETLINQCYFAMERFYYGAADWMSLTEGDTDLWTYKANESTSYTQWFWFFAGTSPNTTYTNNWWNGVHGKMCHGLILLDCRAQALVPRSSAFSRKGRPFLFALLYNIFPAAATGHWRMRYFISETTPVGGSSHPTSRAPCRTVIRAFGAMM